VRDILTTSVQGRIDEARLHNNIDDILLRLADWDVGVEPGVEQCVSGLDSSSQ